MEPEFKQALDERITEWKRLIATYPKIFQENAVRSLLEPLVRMLPGRKRDQDPLYMTTDPGHPFNAAKRFFESEDEYRYIRKDEMNAAEIRDIMQAAFADVVVESQKAAADLTAEKVIAMQRHKVPLVQNDGLVVLPEVYYDWDSTWRVRVLDQIMTAKGKRVLDYMTGTGIAACLAARQGASAITLMDSSPRALENALINLKNAEYTGRVDAVKVNEHKPWAYTGLEHDIIIANFPFCKEKVEYNASKRNLLDMACYNNTSTMQTFFEPAWSHLEKNGSMYAIFASYSDIETINREMVRNNLVMVRGDTSQYNGALYYAMQLRKKKQIVISKEAI